MVWPWQWWRKEGHEHRWGTGRGREGADLYGDTKCRCGAVQEEMVWYTTMPIRQMYDLASASGGIEGSSITMHDEAHGGGWVPMVEGGMPDPWEAALARFAEDPDWEEAQAERRIILDADRYAHGDHHRHGGLHPGA